MLVHSVSKFLKQTAVRKPIVMLYVSSQENPNTLKNFNLSLVGTYNDKDGESLIHGPVPHGSKG